MNATRRDFLTGAAAVALAPLLPRVPTAKAAPVSRYVVSAFVKVDERQKFILSAMVKHGEEWLKHEKYLELAAAEEPQRVAMDVEVEGSDDVAFTDLHIAPCYEPSEYGRGTVNMYLGPGVEI